MSEPLPDPIRDVLRDPVDEVAVQRMWRQIAARRAQDPTSVRRARTTRYVAGGTIALAVAAAAVFVLARAGRGARGSEPGPLHLLGGGEVAATVEVPRGAGRDGQIVELDDGSRVTAAPGAHLEVLENTGRTFATHLARGRVAFEVHPGGPRRWSIECGVATVEVVGTGFVLDRRRDDAVRVDVMHGVVLVRGERVRDRVQRLTAGQWIEVGGASGPSSAVAARDDDASSASGGEGSADDPSRVARPDEPTVAPQTPEPGDGVHGEPDGGGEPAVARPDEPREEPPPSTAANRPPHASSASHASGGSSAAASSAASDWRALAEHAAYQQAYDALGEGGVARETRAVSSAEDLMRLADIASRSRHFTEAVAPLERVLREHAGSSSALLATLTLARLELEQLGNARRAADLFERAHADARLAQPLRESALADLVAARARVGDAAGARAAAAQFERTYPQSRWLPAVRRHASGAP